MNPLVVVAGAMLVQQTLITFASNAVPVLLPPITGHFGINPGLLGVFTSVLFGVGIATAVASGGVIQRFGAFRVSRRCPFFRMRRTPAQAGRQEPA